MHTEEQAKELWCPMVRVANGHQATNCSVNVIGELTQPSDLNCIASRCAMWRWADPYAPGSTYGQGYCGLAGCPVSR